MPLSRESREGGAYGAVAILVVYGLYTAIPVSASASADFSEKNRDAIPTPTGNRYHLQLLMRGVLVNPSR